jgi:hypothetical protein
MGKQFWKIGQIGRNHVLCYVATVIKIVRYWARDRHTDEWTRIKNLEVSWCE